MRRTPLALAALAVLATAFPSSAAPRHFLTDPAGDALVPVSSYDILSLDLATRGGTTTVHGRRVSTPRTLVASVTLAGDPTSTPGLTVHVNSELTTCVDGGFLTLYYQTPGVVDLTRSVGYLDQPTAQISACGAGTGVDPSREYDGRVTVHGSTITWEIPLAPFGSKMAVGTGLSNTEVVMYQDEPVTGAYTTDIVTPGTQGGIDSATTERTFVVR